MEPFNPGAAPLLFPEFDKQQTQDTRYAYVEHVLTQLAEAGELYLTDALAQPEPIRTFVAEIICGLRREPRSPGEYEQTRGHPVPMALEQYRVKIRSIPWLKQHDKEMPDGTTQTTWREVENEPIAFQLEKRRLVENMTYEAARQQGGVWAKTPGKYVEDWYVADGPEADLPLKYAFWALSQYGKNVKRAPKRRAQRELWRFEEVKPSSKPKRGRPRKEQAEMVANAE